MAYDPYSRGDNPWLGNLDMPRSNPTAKPGAARAASLAPAKKKPLPDVPLPPPRPVGIGESQNVPLPADLAPPPRVTGPEATAPLGGPPIPLPPTRPAGIGAAIGSPAPAMPPPRPQQMAGIPGGILQPGFFEKLFGQRPPGGVA